MFEKFFDDLRHSQSYIRDIFKFITRYGVVFSKNSDQYMSGQYSKKRFFYVSLLRAVTLLTGIRYAVTAIVNRNSILALFCDANHILGHGRLISSMMSIGAFTIFYMGIVIQYQEFERKFNLIDFVDRLEKGKLEYLLNNYILGKWQLKVNLITKYFMSPMFCGLVVFSALIVNGSTLMAYFIPGSGFRLLSVIIWAIIYLIWLINFYSIFITGVVVWYAVTQYGRYKFREIHNKVVFSYKFGLNLQLMNAMTEHNSASDMVHKLDQFFKHMVFILYYFGVPANEILIYLAFDDQSLVVSRCVAAYLFVVLFTGNSLMNLWSARMTNSAHKSYRILFRIIISQRMKLTIRERLKVLSFIEKLSGPDIGFYCLDFFPMNGFEFFQYLFICEANYFLILSFV